MKICPYWDCLHTKKHSAYCTPFPLLLLPLLLPPTDYAFIRSGGPLSDCRGLSGGDWDTGLT